MFLQYHNLQAWSLKWLLSFSQILTMKIWSVSLQRLRVCKLTILELKVTNQLLVLFSSTQISKNTCQHWLLNQSKTLQKYPEWKSWTLSWPNTKNLPRDHAQVPCGERFCRTVDPFCWRLPRPTWELLQKLLSAFLSYIHLELVDGCVETRKRMFFETTAIG